MDEDARLHNWLTALQRRHQSSLTSVEFLKALRALSARYVERRAVLAHRSPLDSAGKRAAFAAFYAPLHLLTTREIIRSIGTTPRAPLHTILDLGCGTGVASAAWALELTRPAKLRAVDLHPWAIVETKWNWKQLGLRGDARRADLVAAAQRLLADPDRKKLAGTAAIAAWSVNELTAAVRLRLLAVLLTLAARGAQILVIEPLARTATPWWNEWATAFVAARGRADEWKFDVALPPRLRALDDAAGFQREALGARSLWIAA